MDIYGFVDRFRQPSLWLLEQQWAQWSLIAVAASLSFLLLLKISRRRRRLATGAAHFGRFTERAITGQVSRAGYMDVAHPAGRGRKQNILTDPTELVSHPEISIRQLRREIFKRDQEESRLEHQVEELEIANEQLRQQIAESNQTYAYFEQKIAELTAANEQPVARPNGQKKAEAKVKEPPRRDKSRPEAAKQKQCRKCKKNKPLTEFHKNASSHDGLARWCKACKTKAAKESRRKRASVRRTAEQPADMCADAPLCVLHHRQTDRLKNARRRAGHASYKAPSARQTEHRSNRFRSQLSSPGLRCPRRQKQREQGNAGGASA